MTYYIEFETNFGATFCYTNVTRITISGGGVKIEGFEGGRNSRHSQSRSRRYGDSGR